MCDGEGIGRGSCRDKENGDFVLEEGGELLLDPPCQYVIAVCERRAFVCVSNCREDFGRDRRRVVTCEIHGWGEVAADLDGIQFCVRRMLVFMARIWQVELGQHCCPNWRSAVRGRKPRPA